MEAPGTAPGSATPIPESVYRHSRQADRTNIVDQRGNLKDQLRLDRNLDVNEAVVVAELTAGAMRPPPHWQYQSSGQDIRSRQSLRKKPQDIDPADDAHQLSLIYNR